LEFRAITYYVVCLNNGSSTFSFLLTTVGTVDPSKVQKKKNRKVSLIIMVTVTSSFKHRGNMKVALKGTPRMDRRRQRRRAKRRTRRKKRYEKLHLELY